MEAVAAGGRAVEEGVVARGRDAVGRGSGSVAFTAPPDCTQMPAEGTRGRSPTIVAWSMSSSLLVARPGSFVAGTPAPASVIVPRRTRQVAPVAIRTPTNGASAVKSTIELPPDLARRSTNAPAVPSTRASRPMSAKRTAWLPTPAWSTTKTSAVG